MSNLQIDTRYHTNLAHINLEPLVLGILGNTRLALPVIIFIAPIVFLIVQVKLKVQLCKRLREMYSSLVKV